jgi:DNA-3-methyladenine glycosylase
VRAGARLRPLPRRFFARDTVTVARSLLGHLLVHHAPRGRRVGRIVEVEAYRGPRDPASHAYRPTPRSLIMYGPPGMAYVYFTYGMHFCVNVVTETRGRAGAVLLRAVEPVGGIEVNGGAPLQRAAAGPGRLTRAMGIDGRHNGSDLTRPPLYIADGGAARRRMIRGRIVAGPRVGIAAATRRPWRFGIAAHGSLSRPFARSRRAARL